jgi:hypothetical protein
MSGSAPLWIMPAGASLVARWRAGFHDHPGFHDPVMITVDMSQMRLPEP